MQVACHFKFSFTQMIIDKEKYFVLRKLTLVTVSERKEKLIISGFIG